MVPSSSKAASHPQSCPMRNGHSTRWPDPTTYGPNPPMQVTNLRPPDSSRVFGMRLNLLPWLCIPERHLPWLGSAGKLATALLKTALLKTNPAFGEKSTHLAILAASGLGYAWTRHSPSSSRHQQVHHRHRADPALQ